MNDTQKTMDSRYRAPALEKGLDILELLAGETEPMTLTAIVKRLGRSHGELFRMVQVLEHRGYIEQDESNEGYRLSDRLFSLGMQQPRVRTLSEVALPIMRQLADTVHQSCHLVLHSFGDIVVIGRVESEDYAGFSVRVGHRRPMTKSVSGAVLYAFQPEAVRRRWEAMFRPPLSKKELDRFRAEADEIREKRVTVAPSPVVIGVTDISAPIMRGGSAAAALTLPYLAKKQSDVPSAKESAELLKEAAEKISEQLVDTDSRI